MDSENKTEVNENLLLSKIVDNITNNNEIDFSDLKKIEDAHSMKLILIKAFNIGNLNLIYYILNNFLQDKKEEIIKELDMLNLAYTEKDWTFFEFLLDYGFDVNQNDCRILSIACFSGENDIVKLLVTQFGAEINNSTGFCFVNACNKCNLEIVKLFWKRNLFLSEVMLQEILRYSNFYENLNFIINSASKKLLINEKCFRSLTENNNIPSIHKSELIEKFMMVDKTEQPFYITVFEELLLKNDFDLAKVIHDNYVNPEWFESFFSDSKILKQATNNSNEGLMKIILKFKHSAKTIEEQILLACKCGLLNILDLLIDYYLKMDKVQNMDLTDKFSSQLVFSAKNGEVEIVEKLLKYFSFSSKFLNDALKWSVIAGNIKIIELLVSNGANLSFDNNYVFRFSAAKENTTILKFLKTLKNLKITQNYELERNKSINKSADISNSFDDLDMGVTATIRRNNN